MLIYLEQWLIMGSNILQMGLSGDSILFNETGPFHKPATVVALLHSKNRDQPLMVYGYCKPFVYQDFLTSQQFYLLCYSNESLSVINRLRIFSLH
jgi:hypothetical protein